MENLYSYLTLIPERTKMLSFVLTSYWSSNFIQTPFRTVYTLIKKTEGTWDNWLLIEKLNNSTIMEGDAVKQFVEKPTSDRKCISFSRLSHSSSRFNHPHLLFLRSNLLVEFIEDWKELHSHFVRSSSFSVRRRRSRLAVEFAWLILFYSVSPAASCTLTSLPFRHY